MCLPRWGETVLLYKPVIYRVSRLALLLVLAVISSSGVAPGEQASASPEKPKPAPTAIPLTTVAAEARSTMATLQAIDTSLEESQSRALAIGESLSDLNSETDAMTADDMKLLKSSPTLDMLHRLKSTWQSFADDLSALTQKLAQRAASLEEARTRLDQLTQIWQATLQSAKQPTTPPPVLQSVQNVVDSIERKRQAAESTRAQILDLEIRLSEQETRVTIALSSVEQVQTQELESILVRDSPPIWSAETGLASEMMQHSGESLSSQLKASSAFTKRAPFAFMIHAVLILVIAIALYWIRRRIRKLADEKPDLQRALPILDLPISNAILLSFIISPSILALAPSLIRAITVTIALVPTAIILRRLLERPLYPIINALIVLYFVSQLQMLVASLPELARFIFLGQILGASLFLVWLLRSQHLRTMAADKRRAFFESNASDRQNRADSFAGGVPGKYFRICQLGQPAGNHISQKRQRRSHTLRRHSDHRRIAYYCPACPTPRLVAGHHSASPDASAADLPHTRGFGPRVLAVSVIELLWVNNSIDLGRAGGAKCEYRNRFY